MSFVRRAVNSFSQTLRSKPLRNAGVLFLGKGTQGVFSLLYNILVARALGPADFGTLMVVHRFTLGIAQLVNFQSWQAVVRYGSIAIENGDHPRFERLLGFARRVDALGALIALAVILFAMPLAVWFFQLPADIVPLARIYGLAVIPIIFSSTSLGVLRLFQRFDLLATQVTVTPLVRLAGSIVLILLHAHLQAYLWLWLISSVVGRIMQSYWAWRELRRRNYTTGLRRAFHLREVPEERLWRFVTGTNASLTLNLFGEEVGTLAVSHFLGSAAAGVYVVAQTLSDMLIKPNTKLLIPAIYPEMARLTARGERAERAKIVSGLLWLTAALSALLLVILGVFGKWIIAHFYGPGFVGAYAPMLWMALAGVFVAVAFPLEPLLIAAGKIRWSVGVRAVAVAVFIAALPLLLPRYGLVGAGMASLVYAFLSAAGFWIASRADRRQTA